MKLSDCRRTVVGQHCHQLSYCQRLSDQGSGGIGAVVVVVITQKRVITTPRDMTLG